MDGSVLCFIDIYAIDDDFDHIIQTDLKSLEEKINKEMLKCIDDCKIKTMIRIHNVFATSSTLEINLYVLNKEIDLIGDTDIVDFINDELVFYTKTPYSLVICKQNNNEDNLCFLENELQ